jgi:N-acetyl-anhydromuramyl-L-alanine amidase AmpD
MSSNLKSVMHQFLYRSLIVAIIFFVGSAERANSRGCEGGICNVCTNCKYCRHCAHEGGVCSVCQGGHVATSSSRTENKTAKNSKAKVLCWPAMKKGDTGAPEVVKTIQYLLKARGYKLAADGLFGKRTKRAVEAFQKSNRLSASGSVSDSTWEKLIIKLQPGNKGLAVHALQLLLTFTGNKVKLTGTFDKPTLNAVRHFQNRRDITVDGIVGRLTWSNLVMEAALIRAC